MHGVQVVAQRGAGHRLPPVVARQRQDPLQQGREAEPLAEREVHPGHVGGVEPVALGGLDDAEQHVRRRQHRHPRGEVLGHAAASSAARAARGRPRARGRSSARAAAPSPPAPGPANWSTVAWLSSGGRRLVTSQREARSTRVRISIRIRVCTGRRAGCRSVFSSSRSGSEPKISRATKLARVSSAGVGAGLPGQPRPERHAGAVDQVVDDLGHDDLPAQRVRRRSAPRTPRASRSGSRPAGRGRGRGRRAGRRRAAPRRARSWSRPAAPTAPARVAPRRARAGGAPGAATGSPSSSRLSTPSALEPAHPVLVHVQQRRRVRERRWPARGSARSCRAAPGRRPRRSSRRAALLRCFSVRSPSLTTRSSRILMLTSWSEVSTPAELSMKSVLIRPPPAPAAAAAGRTRSGRAG